MDDAIQVPGRTNQRLTREELKSMAIADVTALRDRAHQQERNIAADNAAYLGGRGREMEFWHRIWIWCSMELDRRATDAAVNGANRVMKQITRGAE